MATSQYFNNYNALSEQRVVEDLIVESIKIMGFDGMYLPNDNDQARDLLYGEDPVKKKYYDSWSKKRKGRVHPKSHLE